LHLSEAGSGAPGTFRFSLIGSYFSGSGFLCNSASPCPSIAGENRQLEDDLDRVGAYLGISATLLPFLEASLGFQNHATSDNRSRPTLLQVLGDTTLAVKAFTPLEPDSMFLFGGEAALWLLNGTGGVGLDGGGTSFEFRALSTVDLNNRSNAADRIPLRFHANLGYLLNNSGAVVEDIETKQPPQGRGSRVSRIERFGLGINRVDSFLIGLGAEYVHDIVRPFLEWTIDVPVNRQDYVCNITRAEDAGDGCLGQNQGFSTTPSRLTIGARVFPWQDHGLALLGAVDIGTGATSDFIEEVSPELPWNLYFGAAYAFDTVAPKPIIQRVEAPPAPPAPAAAPQESYVLGSVVDKKSAAPVPDAIVRFEGREITGMVTNADGTFRTINLEPGTYTFAVSAPGYRPGQCSATVTPPGQQAPAAAQPAQPQAGVAGPPLFGQNTPPQAAPPATATGPNIVKTQCDLEALPKVGNIIGSAVDSETQAPVNGVKVKVTDRLNRELELQADASGAFRFENVPPGVVKLTVEAPGYFTSVSEVTVKAREDLQQRVLLNKRPAQPNVVVAGKEIKLKKQVHFQHDSADILPDSMAILEELADVFAKRADIKSVEVQGHTDNTGSAPYNLRLSQSRAQAVVDALGRLGVDTSRLQAKGYGQEKPLVPNTTDANKARNRRVQIMIQAQGK
jgi:outer membrane protein OmpA-like peptidoglycan-associated protein